MRDAASLGYPGLGYGSVTLDRTVGWPTNDHDSQAGQTATEQDHPRDDGLLEFAALRCGSNWPSHSCSLRPQKPVALSA